MDRTIRALLLVSVVMIAARPAAARPVESSNVPRFEQRDTGAASTPRETSLLSGGYAYVYFDTVTYGGTVWAPDSNRWEALRGTGVNTRCWTFDTGVGSNFTEPTQVPKPPGYHHRMEGWSGIDRTYNPLPFFRRTTSCAITGNYSLWAGVTLAEAESLCYAGGQGYGNNWNITMARSFTYPGTGSVTFSYAYRVETEAGYDYLHVTIDTTGTGAAPDVELVSYDGTVSGTANHTLTRGVTLRSTSGPIRIKFIATSDAGYSDEDGNYVTVCGHSALDDITLSGAISHQATFESGTDGWARADPLTGPGGDWSHLRSLSTLPPPLSFCPCALADSVLLFDDLSGGHQTAVDNLAGSPWCDLLANGDAGKPGKLIIYHTFQDLPLTNYIFQYGAISWYPAVCPVTGRIYTHPFKAYDGPIYYFSGVPGCTTPFSPLIIDMSNTVDSYVEQVRVAVGILSYCSLFSNCTGVSNATPWFDNISFGVFGAPLAPIITLRTIDVFQDNFARDGTLNPAAPARIDVNNIKGAANPQPGTVLGDTLVIFGDGGNQEVRVVFRVRPGPFTSLSALAAWASAKWSSAGVSAPGYFQNTWFEARCDTAEQGGVKSTLKWMSTLHEQDPKFGGGSDTDRGGEGDANQLSHDIFPDNILTPGSRIDYFVKARYLPPDPRNPSGTNVYLTPDTTGGRYLEVEILPSSMSADTTWNCTLHVDHRADRDGQAQWLAEQGLSLHLGPGGANAEGTRYDRYDVQAPSSQQASFGRPLNTQYGASIVQTFAYKMIAWHTGNLASFNLVDEDANNLSAWLTIGGVGGNRFWASGDGLVRAMSGENEPTTINFLNYICGVSFTCDTIRLSGCPAGSVLDSTFCLPLANVSGAAFTTTTPTWARGNGCPNLRSFDVLRPNPSVATARRQMTYLKNGVPLAGSDAFSVTNHVTAGVDYMTVIDGVEVGYLRDPNGNPHALARCDITTPSLSRTDNVLSWFESLGPVGPCGLAALFTGVPSVDGGGPATYRTQLLPPAPNPMSGATRVRFTLGGVGGRAAVRIFDVTGRLVRTLLDAPLPAGPHDITWDGADTNGRPVTAGLYFVRLATPREVQSMKVIVRR